ncbi:MAG: hypothetical protein IT473_10905 [Lysobacter sp.]|nr:hypothetical protein [Lysobacter sp.]
MKRFRIIAALTVVLTTSCATTPKQANDWSLQWSNQSARLIISEDNGDPLLPFQGRYLSLPGYIFVANQISLHPGTHRISYACPGEWSWRQITHYIPSVEHTFESGKRYELYCIEGEPHIRMIESEIY